MSRFVYFHYSGDFYATLRLQGPARPYRYIVEVCKKDCDGGDRDSAELKRVALSLLHMYIGEERAKEVANFGTQVEISQQHFDETRKTLVYSTQDGGVYHPR